MIHVSISIYIHKFGVIARTSTICCQCCGHVHLWSSWRPALRGLSQHLIKGIVEYNVLRKSIFWMVGSFRTGLGHKQQTYVSKPHYTLRCCTCISSFGLECSGLGLTFEVSDLFIEVLNLYLQSWTYICWGLRPVLDPTPCPLRRIPNISLSLPCIYSNILDIINAADNHQWKHCRHRWRPALPNRLPGKSNCIQRWCPGPNTFKK